MGSSEDLCKLTQEAESVLRSLSHLAANNPNASHFIIASMPPVEVHVSDSLRLLVKETRIGDNLFGQFALDELGDSLTINWPSRIKALSAGFGIELSGTREWQDFDTLIDLRNALIHGDGNLSEKQRVMKLTKILDLKRRWRRTLDAEWSARGVILGSQSVTLSLKVTFDFLTLFDKSLRDYRHRVRSMRNHP